MRISDWSSDVCSSDLDRGPSCGRRRSHARRRIPALTDEQRRLQPRLAVTRHALEIGFQDGNVHAVETRLSLIEVDEGIVNIDESSEERRVGKECVSTCRSRWSTYHSQKKEP